MREKDVIKYSRDQLLEMNKSGRYLLPLDVEEMLEDYEAYMAAKESQDFAIFNYKTRKHS